MRARQALHPAVMPFHRITVLLCALAMISCTERSGIVFPDGGPIDAQVGGDGGHDAGPRPDSGPDLSSVVIFAHSRDTLFSFSPFTNTVTTIGVFTLPDGSAAPYMTDLAVNAANEIYTCSNDALFRVDPVTAVATRIGTLTTLGGDQLFALTFLVPGELGDTEVLLGATNSGVYYRLDPATAMATRVGQYPDGWLSSGDLVSVEGLGTFATIRRDDFPTDLLARIDFITGGASVVDVIGETGYDQLFGLGYWGSKLYAFSNSGELVEIDRTTGVGTIATADTGTMQFWGAGVTTRVPVIF